MSLRRRALLAYLAILVMLLVVVGVSTAQQGVRRESAALETRLLREAQALALAARGAGGRPEATPLLLGLAQGATDPGTAVVVLTADGQVVYASGERPPPRPLSAPEVQDALSGRIGASIRHGDGSARRHFLAAPIRGDAGAITGAVQLAAPPVDAAAVARQTAVPFLVGGALAALAGTAAHFLFIARLQRSVNAITVVANSLARGDLEKRVEERVVSDTAQLAASVNQMAQSLERQVRDSTEERDTLSAVIQTMADALFVIDEEGAVSMVNPAAAQLFKLSPEETMGTRFIEAVRDHDIVRLFQRARDVRRPQFGQVEWADARLLRVAAIPIDQEGPSAVLVMVQDLTDLQRLQSMRRDFVANVSHELRTPLASIKASVEALEAGALDDRALAEDFLRRMGLEVNTLTDMVQRLLELSRVETGQAVFNPTPLRLRSSVEEVADRLRPQIDRQQLTLETAVGTGLPLVLADSSALAEVLLNLLGNSIKFTPPGGKIVVSAEAIDGVVEVQVRDNGQGISPQHLPHIFERFYKADRSRSSEGAGLGLALVKHLVQAQGGRVWAESVEGRGSTFHFTLPRA